MKFDILIANFPYGRSEDPDVGRWIGDIRIAMLKDERIGRIMQQPFDDTPITMTRNHAVEVAKEAKADILVMVDSDMSPDCYLDRPQAKPFWQSSFDFMLEHNGPCIVAAPYCGPPPEELCYIFQLTKRESEHPNVDHALSMIPREDASKRLGIEEVIALPTGLIAIDMRVFKAMKPPYFDYEYTDEFHTKKASTEDVFFTRNASFVGAKVYCNWYSWAGHWKRKRVGPPTILTPDMVRQQYREAIAKNHLMSNQSLLFLKGGNLNGVPPNRIVEKEQTGSIQFHSGAAK